MAGNICSEEKLNCTLLKISQILEKYSFKTWFIAYGTLLGIIRNNSCIDGDDDIDIICDKKDFYSLKKILLNEGFDFEKGYGIKNNESIIKTLETVDFCSIDFYMTEVSSNGDFIDHWEKTIWTDCFCNSDRQFNQLLWRGSIINLPNDYKSKLKARYGKDWRIPKKFKGIPRGKIKSLILNFYLAIPIKIRKKLKILISKNKLIEKFLNRGIMGKI